MSQCRRFEEWLDRGTENGFAELETHAAACGPCREELELWNRISQAAPSLRKRWESPGLWVRIEKSIHESRRADEASRGRKESRAWWPLLAAAALFLVAMIGLRVFRPSLGERELLTSRSFSKPLLTEDALSDVEKSEERYVASIERLSRLAEPKLRQPSTPLLISYREKLLLLDTAIAELRSQLDQNRFNTHLRKELLAAYQEKQHTLEQVVKEEKS
ncbi:MAG TPA: hypothetical protein VKE50_01995 [Thermoanaerobaculia bacterium]|nr:hypothetical protein [Thermoanaerobaculia bacterium]